MIDGLSESVLQSTDRLNAITVNSNVPGCPIGTVASDIKANLSQIKVPEVYRLNT